MMSFAPPQMILSVALLTLVFATCEDLVRHRISNVLVLCALTSGLILNVATDAWSGLGHSVLGLGIGLGLLLPIHLLKGAAAGDVKLMAAIGSLVGPATVVWCVAYTLISGAALALLYVCWRVSSGPGLSPGAVAIRALTWKSTLNQVRKERFPYALAIAIGSLVALWQEGALDMLVNIEDLNP